MKTILIILITSLFWVLGIFIYQEYGNDILNFVEQTEEVVEIVEDKVDVVEEKFDAVEDKVERVVQQSVSAPKPSPTKPKVEQPKTQPKVAKPKAPAKNYAELILGYWLPVEGTTSKLDISKYGTVTRHYKLYSSWYEDRYEYSVSGNKLTVNDYYKCTVNVFEENGETYLEVYGHEDYAGKYKKRK